MKVKYNDNSKEENYKIFKEKFLKAIEIRLRADVPVGSCLSGGLDSSSIVCAVHENLKNKNATDIQHTVSSCFDDKKYDEQEYIDAVVRDTSVEAHKVFPDMGEVFDVLDKIIWHMDEPFAGTSIFAQWNVFKTAKEHGLTVMLDGQGADEQLAGYTPFYQVLFVDLFKRGKFKQLNKEIKSYLSLRAGTEVKKPWEIMASALVSAVFPESFKFKLHNVYRKFIGGGMPFPDRFYNNKVYKKSHGAYNMKDARKYIDASMHQGMRSLLHYEDRDSMAHSIESRVPFLDYELAEFIFSVPIGQKIEEGKTKNIMREGLKDILPTEIYNRYSKLGFVTPEDKWLKENEEFFYDELEKACDVLSAIVEKERVMNWYKSHVQKTKRGDSTCFRIICAAHWVQVFGVDLSLV